VNVKVREVMDAHDLSGKERRIVVPRKKPNKCTEPVPEKNAV
jgi:hypothetical protein